MFEIDFIQVGVDITFTHVHMYTNWIWGNRLCYADTISIGLW